MEQQLEQYQQNGFVSYEGLFDQDTIDRIKQEVNEICQQDMDGTVYEQASRQVRGLHGCHLYNELFAQLIRDKRLMDIAQQIIGSDVYVHQLKVNFKNAFVGEKWDWHQDFIFWHKEDYIPQNRMVNIMIPLEPVTQFNGPLFFIPGSHQQGMLTGDALVDNSKDEEKASWQHGFVKSLKYRLNSQTVTDIVEQYGIHSCLSETGDVVVFNGNLVHASSPNISPFDRKVLIITYNDINNVPRDKVSARPDFIAAKKVDAILPA